MQTAQALRELGVSAATLRDDVRARLDRDGFAVIDWTMPPALITALRNRLQELADEEGERAGAEVHREAGTDRVSDLVNKDPVFDVLFTQPEVLAAVSHVLSGDLKLSATNSRAALPGQGHQRLHTDWPVPVAPDAYQVCNSIWLLDDFTEDNGATRLVAGSHRRASLPAAEMADVNARHPEEQLLLAPAGTVVVFNSHLWHGGTMNRTQRPRMAIHSYFCRREHAQQLDQAAFLRPATRARLGPAALFTLDV